jgi:GTP-binding protein
VKISSAKYVLSAVKPSQWPEGDLPEIALAGRSNVGKSSLINTLLNRKNLARTSQKPGKTQTLNYYLINDAFYFVDVPGYGYAQVSKSERAAWARMLETYFTENRNLRGVVQLVDFRHPPSKDDIQMYEYLKYFQIPTIVAATKSDKISKGRHQKHKKIIREGLQMVADDPLVVFSSFNGTGKEELWQEIEKYLDHQMT